MGNIHETAISVLAEGPLEATQLFERVERLHGPVSRDDWRMVLIELERSKCIKRTVHRDGDGVAVEVTFSQ